MYRLIALTFLLFGASPLAAQDVRWYQIELVVFENLAPSSLKAENWPDDPGFPDFANAIELQRFNDSAGFKTPDGGFQDTAEAPFSEPSEAFILLEPADRHLNDISARLRQAEDYRVLAHVAWRQPFEKGGQAVPIHFHSFIGSADPEKRWHQVTVKKTYRDRSPDQADAGGPAGSAQSTPAWGEPFIEQVEELLPVPLIYPLDGVIKIKLGRYLHLQVDLILQRDLTEEITPQSMSDSLQKVNENTKGFFRQWPDESSENLRQEITRTYRFRFSGSRRMRSKELHYLDHPVIGVVAYMIPYDPFAGSGEERFEQ